MSVTTSALRELHRFHRQIKDLTGRLTRGPAQIKAGEANVTKLVQDSNEAKERLTRLRVRADERQLQLQEREDRILDLKGKLNRCSSNREYQALSEQIAADEQANNVLTGEILEALEDIDERQVKITKLESEADSARSHLDELRARVEKSMSGLKSELDRVTEGLRAAESTLPGDLKVDYYRITQARGEDALAAIDGDVCGSCYRTLTIQTVNELLMAKPVFCSSCGALLYLPEDREPSDLRTGSP